MLSTILNWVVVGLFFISLLAIARAYKGPTVLDRVVAMNIITTNVVITILIFSYLDNSYYYIDVAFVFVLGGFIGTLCILKLLREGHII
ncbi:MAG: monovalent cation/H+ antiporter complex subunit F [Bacillota bacterium]|nr:monovalent cation/H+ antiporter complex subunit F [Bacillota bacterium]